MIASMCQARKRILFELCRKFATFPYVGKKLPILRSNLAGTGNQLFVSKNNSNENKFHMNYLFNVSFSTKVPPAGESDSQDAITNQKKTKRRRIVSSSESSDDENSSNMNNSR